jgi:hypothetical protein
MEISIGYIGKFIENFYSKVQYTVLYILDCVSMHYGHIVDDKAKDSKSQMPPFIQINTTVHSTIVTVLMDVL